MLNFNVVQLHGAAIEVLEPVPLWASQTGLGDYIIDWPSARPESVNDIKSALGSESQILVEDDQRLTTVFRIACA